MALLNILIAILGLSVLVIVHESGHYFVARAFGMRVLRYSIGFGPTLWKYKPKDSPTTFQVGAIPFLAYVQIDGMLPSDERDPDDPGLFQNKGVLARALTIAAGPAANYILATLIIFVLALFSWYDPVDMVVGEVIEGGAAETAGIQPGDRFVEAGGTEIHDIGDLQAVTAPRAGQPTEYVVERDGERLPPITITPRESDRQPGVGLIGVAARDVGEFRPYSVSEAAAVAIRWPWETTAKQIAGLGSMIRRRTTEGISGPIGMTRFVGQQASHGLWWFVHVLALLSVALGFFNLLPIPALDGGRLMFLAFEVITRRRPNEQIEAVVHFVGILFLLGVLVLVSIRDVVSPPLGATREADEADSAEAADDPSEPAAGDNAAPSVEPSQAD